jgi:divalent metal cation (Fe/Co/Zn/Cd) transporter
MAGGSKKVIYAALIGNGLIAIAKFVGSVITGSAAMMSEGIHSVVDTGNQLLLLLGLKRAKKPADKEYPFGHGKEIYFFGTCRFRLYHVCTRSFLSNSKR